MTKYKIYQKEIKDDINSNIEHMGCQPILFIGAGLSIRYFNAPNWEELLESMANKCPNINYPFAYYKQTKKDLIQIGTEFSDNFLKWAWDDQSQFPSNLFTPETPKDSYFKFKIAEEIDALTPKRIEDINSSFKDEIDSFQRIRPHAIITTNYDKLLEIIFPEYTPIIGQKVLRTEFNSIGEIFKIHGCSTDYKSIVINEEDYAEFQKKKKYLSAKLLTYFAEHPLLFIGYKAEDPNIKAILSDIDELLTNNENELVPNIYFLERNDDIDEAKSYAKEKTILLDNNKTIRVKNIVANSYSWVYEAFSVEGALEKINPKLLRALLARTYELVRTDVPRKTVEINYKSLSSALNDDDGVAKIFGITETNNPEAFNLNFPLTLTSVAKKLVYNYWYGANELLTKILKDKKIDIKISDNNYHVAVQTGEKTTSHKYSEELVSLLVKVKNKEEYTLNLHN